MWNKLKTSLQGNIYVALLLRLLLVLIVYTITRFLFYVLNRDLFADADLAYILKLMYHGLRFDISAIAYTNSLIILLHILPFRFRYNEVYQKIISGIFYLVNSLAIILNLGDAIYYRFTLRRTTSGVFNEFQNENPFSFIRFIWEYWYVTLIVIFLIFGMIWLYNLIKVKRPHYRTKNLIYYPISILLMSIVGYYTVGGMRGGYKAGTRPITLSNAAEFIIKPEHRSIVLNTPFSIIRTLGKKELEIKSYFNEDELRQLFYANHNLAPATTDSLYNKFKGRNVVVIIWESFSKEWVASLNRDIKDYNGFTPFIDSLSNHAYVFSRAYANGRKSIDALPSIIASIPSSETPFISSHYSGNKINSLASILKEEGYNTAFFHGAPNGSMGFSAFMKQAGFDRYFGMTEYNNNKDFDGAWGIWDEPYLQHMASELHNFKEPFLSVVFTLSSHDPYNVPKEYEGVFPKGDIPIHQCVAYSDNALRNFFNSASKEDWFNNTLFVITGDHAVNGSLSEYKNANGAFAIPLILYAPNSDLIGRDDTTVVQQTDILPTVLSLMGAHSSFVSFGNNIFDTNSPHFAYNYFNGAHQLIAGEWMLQYMNEQSIGLYNIVQDRLMKNNQVGKELAKQKELEDLLNAYIQQYNNRLILNELVIE